MTVGLRLAIATIATFYFKWINAAHQHTASEHLIMSDEIKSAKNAMYYDFNLMRQNFPEMTFDQCNFPLLPEPSCFNPFGYNRDPCIEQKNAQLDENFVKQNRQIDCMKDVVVKYKITWNVIEIMKRVYLATATTTSVPITTETSPGYEISTTMPTDNVQTIGISVTVASVIKSNDTSPAVSFEKTSQNDEKPGISNENVTKETTTDTVSFSPSFSPSEIDNSDKTSPGYEISTTMPTDNVQTIGISVTHAENTTNEIDEIHSIESFDTTGDSNTNTDETATIEVQSTSRSV